MSVKIITDSTADLSPDICHKITVVPLTIRFGEEEFIDGVTISHREFYEKLVSSPHHPSTSQANIDDFDKVFKKITDDGDSAVVINISSELSGTYHSARMASEEYKGKIYVLDSRNLCLGSGILVSLAQQYADEGKSAEDIFALLEKAKEKIRLVALFDTMEYLKRGGRISAATAFVGNLLSIKPAITITDGKVAFLGKARGRKQGRAFMTEYIKTKNVDISKPILFGHTGKTSEDIEEYIEETKDIFGNNGRITEVGSVVGAHSGPDAIAVAFFEE